MRYDEPRPVWTRLDHQGGEEQGSVTDKTSKLQPGEGCQRIGMLSSCLVEAARASARVSATFLSNIQNKVRRSHTIYIQCPDSSVPCVFITAGPNKAVRVRRGRRKRREGIIMRYDDTRPVWTSLDHHALV